MDTPSDAVKNEQENSLELLRLYMALCDEQAGTIEAMSKLIRKQSEKIREMQDVHGFMDMDV